MEEIVENEQIKPKLWQWAGGICLFFNIVLKIIRAGSFSFAGFLGVFSRLLLFVIVLICVPTFRYVAKKIYIKNFYGKSFVVGFIGWFLLQFIVSSAISVLLMKFNVLAILIVSLIESIFYAPIYMIIAVLLIKYKKQYFVEIDYDQNRLVDVIERDEVDQNGNLGWGKNSLWGFILGFLINVCIFMQLSLGMGILVYFSFGIPFLLLTSVIGSGIFALAGKTLEIENVLIKSIIIGIVGYSLYYFGVYYVVYLPAISLHIREVSAHIQEDRSIWVYMICAIHVAISTFLYVLLMVKEQRKKIFLVGVSIALFFLICAFYLYAYF